MGSIVTNKNAFPGTQVEMSNNKVDITLGSKSELTLGTKNIVDLGSYNKLSAGVETVIHIGSVTSTYMGSLLRCYEGDTFKYYAQRGTISDVKTSWGVHVNLSCGGVSTEERDSRWTEAEQSRTIRFATIISYLAVAGATILALKYPAFKMVKVDNDKDEEEDTYKPELTDLGYITIVLQTLETLMLFFAQWTLTKRMADRLRDFNAVANLSLASNGLTSAVFSDPERQPMLVGDKYDKFEDGSNAPIRVNMDPLDPNAKNSTSGSSPAAIFNMLPGKVPDKYHEDVDEDPYFGDWRNLRKGKYPKHNNNPIITLRSQLELHKRIYSAIDILPESIIITSHNGYNTDALPNEDKDGFRNASIIVQSGLSYDKPNENDPVLKPKKINDEDNKKESLVTITAKDIKDNGGLMSIGEKSTQFFQKGDDTQLFSVAVMDEKVQKLSALSIDNSSVSLATNCGEDGFFADSEGLHLVVDTVKQLSIDKKTGQFNIQSNSKVSINGDLFVKGGDNRPKNSKLPVEKNSLSEHITDKINTIKLRVALIDNHIKNTGGFSGSVDDDTRKYAKTLKQSYTGSSREIKIGSSAAGKFWEGVIGTFTGIRLSFKPKPKV